MSIEFVNWDGSEAYSSLKQMPGREWHIKELCSDTAIIRGCTPDDIIAMSIWADARNRAHCIPATVYIPYLPGARQDRAPVGEALSCKVYADLINRCGFQRVYCIDPHSDVMPALINNLEITPLTKVIEKSLLMKEKFVGVIAPDAGAIKRATLVANHLNLPVYQALKKRDQKTGKLSFTSCETLPTEGKLLVVDDICDGGGTFKQLATNIQLPKERLALWVTHGIFSNGAENLPEYFSNIYTTDSVDYPNLYQYEIKFLRILDRVPLKEIYF